MTNIKKKKVNPTFQQKYDVQSWLNNNKHHIESLTAAEIKDEIKKDLAINITVETIKAWTSHFKLPIQPANRKKNKGVSDEKFITLCFYARTLAHSIREICDDLGIPPNRGIEKILKDTESLIN